MGQTVASDRNLNVTIGDYDTFAWSSHAANDQDIYFLSNAILKGKLRDAIRYELEARNFDYSEENADLVVNFRVFKDPVTFSGYEKTYADQNYWGPNEIRKDAIGIIPLPERRELDDAKDYYMEAGSLLVQLVDTNTGLIVWQGYATEMLDESGEGEIKKTVQKLFGEEFNFSS